MTTQTMYWTNWTNSTTGTATGQYPAGQYGTPATPPAPQPKPKKPKFSDRVLDAFERLAVGGPMKPVKQPSAKDIKRFDLRPIGGAAPEAEVKKTVEHKKKIKLQRTVGVKRDKGGKEPTPTHSGTVELVRTMEGPEHQTANIGIKAEGNGSSYVEIPADDLRAALDELDPPAKED